MKSKKYYVYILECSDLTLYTGITTEIERRVIEHNTSKKGAKYTSSRRPVKLVYISKGMTRVRAMKEELRIKSKSRKQKKDIIFSQIT